MRPDTTIVEVTARRLDAPLSRPFATAARTLPAVTNVAARVTLRCGVSGWGEIPSLRPVTAEDQAMALDGVTRAAPALAGLEAARWRAAAAAVAEALPDLPATRAGLEVALLDALCRALGVPLVAFFGGAADAVVTDVTIPICPEAEAEALAAGYRARGFATLKTKVGLDVDADIARLLAVRRGHPTAALVVDANGGYTADQALAALDALRRAGVAPALLEQPVARDDWDGLGRVTREGGVPVAADESCRSPADALRIARGGLATAVNIKLAKSGVAGALDIAAVARAAGLDLMMGGMVETRLGMGAAAHLVAGLGGFRWVDLDTPLLLARDPVRGGVPLDGPRYRLAGCGPGHGMAPAAT